MDMHKRNFRAFLVHAVFLALTLNLMDINTVVPAMIAQSGGTALHMGLLSAIMIGGTRFMQLVFAGMIVPLPKKKPALLAGIYLRVASLFILAFFIGSSKESSMFSVWMIILVMTIFSFSGAYANIAYTDIMGKVIVPQRRKRLLVIKQLLSSIGVILSAFAVKFVLSNLSYPSNYSFLFLLGGTLLLFGTIGFWMIAEPAGVLAKRVPLREQMKQLTIVLRSDRNLRMYLVLINTSGTVVSTLPFLLLFANTRFHVDGAVTGTFLLMQMTGALATTILLSLFSRNQRYRPLVHLFILTGSSIPILALLLPADPRWYSLVFILSGVAHTLNQILSSGILLEISDDSNRALYTGISGAGSVMQVLYPMLFGVAARFFGYPVVFVLTAIYMLAGIPAARALRCTHLETRA